MCNVWPLSCDGFVDIDDVSDNDTVRGRATAKSPSLGGISNFSSSFHRNQESTFKQLPLELTDELR